MWGKSVDRRNCAKNTHKNVLFEKRNLSGPHGVRLKNGNGDGRQGTELTNAVYSQASGKVTRPEGETVAG